MGARGDSLSLSSFLLHFSTSYLTKRKPFSIAAAMGDDPISEWIMSEGKATKIITMSPVGGGCINVARRYDTDAGPFFVKTNRSIGPEMFEEEALGLGTMYETNTIRVPKPYKLSGEVGPLPISGSYIIMEFIEFGASRGNQSEKGFGFDADNTIGSTPQINTWTSDWIEFYGQHRLGYQLKLAVDQYGDSTIYQKGQRLVKSMAPLFENIVIEPCLLHGDLWSGNISSDKNGEPVILDPACYYGHNEAEFGMSWCAGFGGAFYNAYFESKPLQKYFEIIYQNNSNMNNNTTSAENPTFPPLPSVQLQELIVSLEQATLMAKQLPATTNPKHLLQITSSLRQAHHHLSSYISHTHQFPPPLLPPPQLSPHAVAENSFSSATAAADENGNEPMQVGDDDYEAGAEENSSKVSVDKVEERMRDCFIKNKRPKRPFSPSSAAVAEERRLCVDDGHVGEMYVFDPHETRLRALDFIYQFHG